MADCRPCEQRRKIITRARRTGGTKAVVKAMPRVMAHMMRKGVGRKVK